MIDALRRWWKKKYPSTVQSITALPELLSEAMKEGRFSAIQDQVQILLKEQPAALEMLLTAAQKQNWPAIEQDKLSAWGAFYCGQLSVAFDQAVRYGGGVHDGSNAGALDPDFFMLAVLSLYHNHQFDDAWRLVERLGARESLFAERSDYWSIKSSLAFSGNHIDTAWVASERARLLQPNDAIIAANAYALAFRLPDMELFNQLHNNIAQGQYGDTVHLNAFALSMSVLAQDDYLEGFRLFEGRYAQADSERYLNPALSRDKRYTNQAIHWPQGRTLLLTCEQGMGDTLQMARYFTQLARITNNRLYIETQPEILPLLSNNFPHLNLLPRAHGKKPKVDYDYWLGSMSLPWFFACTAASVPGKGGYIKESAEHAIYWKQRIPEIARGRKWVGLTWSGSPTHRTDRQRSISFALIAEYVRRWPQVDFFALQTQVPAERPANLHDVSAELLTFGDTAGLVAQMDLVISVDTSAIHLAGALGKPSWLLLPYRYEWRWSLEGEANHWYDSVKVLRQVRHGDWKGLLDEAFGTRLTQHLDLQGER